MSQPTDPMTALLTAVTEFGKAQYHAGLVFADGPVARREANARVDELRANLFDLIRSLTVYHPTGLHKLVDKLLAKRAEFAAGDRTQYRAAVEAAQKLAAAGRRAETDLADELWLLDRNACTDADVTRRAAAVRNRRSR